MVTNSCVDSSSYVGSNGKKTSNQWVQVKSKWKYKFGNGNMYDEDVMVLIDGKLYYFDTYEYLGVSYNFIYENVAYVADENGDATRMFGPIGSTSQETKVEWKQTNGKWWYQHKDGTYTKMILKQFQDKHITLMEMVIW